MSFLRTIAAALTILSTLACGGWGAEPDKGLHTVVEFYDAVLVVHESCESRAWEVHRVYFFRNQRIIADRILVEDMVFGTCGPHLTLTWSDYANCVRVIGFKDLSEAWVELDDGCRDGGLWHDMRRRMTDLVVPPE